MAARAGSERIAMWALSAACLLPAAWLIWRTLSNQLGANPIEEIIRELGVWGLRLLILDLAVSPAAQLARQPRLIRYRRPIGLFAFGYVCLHLAAFIGLDQFFDWSAIWKDILKRPFITFGMVGFALLAPLALTSTNAALRRLGPHMWRRLHQLAYAAAILGVVHYYMLVKADHRPPLIYGAVLAILLGYRLARWTMRRAARAAA
ncbi:MAG: sulfite oxidase heme-binding subunit YedZ [Hyphomonadaceae bacterium]